MALLDDSVTVAFLAGSAFFVVLAIGLLLRYRQVSEKISASSDLGRDLWQALDQRMKKQDERILDMMGRLEVVQSRVMTAAASVPSPAVISLPPPVVVPEPMEKPPVMTEPGHVVQQAASQPESRESQPAVGRRLLDETQSSAVKLLGDAPKNTRQLTDALGKSREHTARLMKELFEMGLVSRNDSTKPFVYQLTDEGRSYLPV